MKTHSFALYFVALATGFFFILAGCSKENQEFTDHNNKVPTDLKAGKSGPSANGHGTFTFEGYKRQFTFHANTMPNGDVAGKGVLNFTASGSKITFDIDCLSIDGNAATMSGIITSSTNPAYVGWACWFKVVDNGEGSGSDPDQISYLTLAEELDDCTVELDPPYSDLYDIDGGNIQVKP